MKIKHLCVCGAAAEWEDANDHYEPSPAGSVRPRLWMVEGLAAEWITLHTKCLANAPTGSADK